MLYVNFKETTIGDDIDDLKEFCQINFLKVKSKFEQSAVYYGTVRTEDLLKNVGSNKLGQPLKLFFWSSYATNL